MSSRDVSWVVQSEGAWHWSVMILAGYKYGKEYIGAPVLGPIVFYISTVMMGILYDYVYEKTETIWLPSLMHGTTNAFTIFAYLSKPEYADKAILDPLYWYYQYDSNYYYGSHHLCKAEKKLILYLT